MSFRTATDSVLYHYLSPLLQDDLYLVPGGKKTRISSIVVVNVDANTKYFTLHLIPSGSSLSDATALSPKQCKLNGTSATNGGGFFAYEVPFPMVTGDKITILSETANTMNIKIVGLEEAIS